MTKTNRYLKVLTAMVMLAAITALTMAVANNPAEAAKPAKTILTIKAKGTDLSGTVKSSKLSCVDDREVNLYKQKGSKQSPNADELVATDTSERQGKIGMWSTGNTGMTGKFYARTGKAPGCSAAGSKTIVVKN